MQTNNGMIEQVKITQRQNIFKHNKYSLVEKLAILLKTHKESKYLCTSTSIAFRVAALCDLAITGYIGLNGTKVKVLNSHKNNILNDILIKIAQINGEPCYVIKSLNGEKKKENAIRNFKNKIYQEISHKAIIERKKGMINNKIVLKDACAWKDVFDEVVQECINNNVSLTTKVILLCLEYINGMQDVLIQLPRDRADMVIGSMNNVKEMLVAGRSEPNCELVFMFLQYLCKKRIFL